MTEQNHKYMILSFRLAFYACEFMCCKLRVLVKLVRTLSIIININKEFGNY